MENTRKNLTWQEFLNLAEQKSKKNQLRKEKEGLDRQAQEYWLKNMYNVNALQNRENPRRWFSEDMLTKLNDQEINDQYYFYVDDPDYISSPLGTGVEVVGYEPLTLITDYPLGHPYYDIKKDPIIGHSQLGLITGHFDDDDYNIVTNNCSNETGNCLAYIFGKDYNPLLFSTPGDVRDFALENGGYPKDDEARVIKIPMNEDRYTKWKDYFKKFISRKRFNK